MRTALFTGIMNHIRSNQDALFVRELSGRIYTGEGKQGGPYPCAVLFLVSDVDGGEIGGTLTEFEWQVSCFSNEFSQVNNLASWCRELFAESELADGEYCFSTLYAATYGPVRDSSGTPWQTTITFQSFGG